MTRSTARASRHRDVRRVMLWVYSVSQLAIVALLLAFLFGSLLFSGAQVMPDGHPLYDEVVPFPVFVVPAWLPIALSAVALIVAIPLAATTRLLLAPSVIPMLAYAAASALASFVFSRSFVEPDGDPGLHWVASVLSIGCLAVAAIPAIRFVPRYDRLRRAGLIELITVSKLEREPAPFRIDLPVEWLRSENPGRDDSWRYAPPAAPDQRLPSMHITVTPHRVRRGTSFIAEHQDSRTLGDPSTLEYAMASPTDARIGVVFTSIVSGDDRVSVGACVDLSDKIVGSFAWK